MRLLQYSFHVTPSPNKPKTDAAHSAGYSAGCADPCAKDAAAIDATWLEDARQQLAEREHKSPEQSIAATLASMVAAMAEDRGLPTDAACAALDTTEPAHRNSLPLPVRTESLGVLYENLLDLTDSAQSQLQSPNRTRKGQGSFFTHHALTQPTVTRTLEGIPRSCGIRLCDPAMGGGAFLLAALRELADRRPDASLTQLASTSIYGIDIDPLATKVARLALWLEVADPELSPKAFDEHLRCGDALVGRRPETSDPSSFCSNGFAWQETWPEVFAKGGFDAILGNPPWDIRKPDSRAFFSKIAPEYSRLGKQEALALQADLFEQRPEVEQAWLEYIETYRRYSHWCRNEAYRHQGRGDANYYKLFLELGINLLRPGGQLGMIVPSGLYTDLGCAPLRRLLLDQSQWRWLFAFENRRNIFPIDSRFKFAPVIVEKGGQTQSVQTAFMRQDPGDWDQADTHALSYDREQIQHFSPDSLAFLEVRDPHDLRVLTQLYANSSRFAKDGPWSIDFRREFDLTIDSARFPPITAWEADGFVRDPLDRWTHPDGRVAVPLSEGRMIGQYDYSQKGWVEGRGRRAQWRDIPTLDKRIEPQYLIDQREMIANDVDYPRDKIAIMAIGSATNERSMHAASLIDSACGNSAPTLRTRPSLQPALLAVLNSFCYDFALRIRLGGININRFVLAETPLPKPSLLAALPELTFATAALNWAHVRYAPAWIALGEGPWRQRPWTDCWAKTSEERTQLRAAIDAVVAFAYGVDAAGLDWILRDCEHSIADLARREFVRKLDPKGFWRVDRKLEPDRRLTNRCRVAFRGLLARIGATESAIDACREFLADALCFNRTDGADNTAQESKTTITASWDSCRQHSDQLRAQAEP